ncbi:MAG: carboxypeptidase regulatory-like domain-containing protein [Planctomycetes bacterium]|nr:carboxypeptidase regulatory-like domain-containing protein [Planctomycetota bacterium]
MRDLRIPLIVAVLVLILAGLAVYFSLTNSPTTRNNARDIAVDGDAFARPLDDAGPVTRKGKPVTDAGADTTSEPDKPDVAPPKPIIKLKVATSISGVALDYFDDPSGGITLTLLPESADEIAGPTTVTDDEGRFVFETELTEGDAYLVACLQEDKALTATGSFTIRKDTPVEGLQIRIFDPARVYGIVLDGDTNQPLEDVDIRLSGRQDDVITRLGELLGRVKPSRSDSDGRFDIGHIAPGSYLVSAVKPGWIAHAFNPITRAMQEIKLDEYANYELLPFILVQSGVVEGRVLKKADNSPIAGATVELGTVLGGSFDSVVTDNDGKFRFETVPPGMGGNNGPGADVGGVAVRATAPGFAIATRDVRVRSGQTRSGVDLLLDSGCTVTGLVTDNKNMPIAGAKVYFNDTDFLRGGEMVAGVALPDRAVSTTTDEAGRFSLAGLPPGDVTITASAQGFANKNQQVVLMAGTPAEVTIMLEPAGGITGVVTNERGEPIEGVPIAVYDATGPGQLAFIMKSFFGEELPDRGESTMFPASIRTDAEGRYLVEGLKPTASILLANSRDFEKYVSPELKVKSGEIIEHNFTLLTGGTIFGRVYDAANQAEGGVPVTCASIVGQSEVRVRTAYTDRGGNYEITGLAEGTYTVIRNEGDLMKLMLPNPANQVKVTRGERVQFDIYSQKPGTARIYGRVTLDGQPYAEKGLVLLGGNFSGFAANSTNTDGSGNYEFRSVPLGTYQIAQSQQGPMPSLVRKRVRVDREGDVEINIDFVTASISGRVELEGGKVPEGNVRVLASPVNPGEGDAGNTDEGVSEFEMMVFREVRADAETGAFEITGLSPGFYRLTVRSENNGMATRPYLNVRASVKGIVMTLPPVGATLKGIVKGLDAAEPNTPFGLIAALTIEDEQGNPIALGGFDNGINLDNSKEFTVENLGDGFFTITLSLTGYTPVTHKNVKLTAGETVALEFAFASSGNAKIILGNQDINISSAFDLTFDIVNSKGEPFKKRFTFLDFFNADGSASQTAEENAFVIKDLPPETYTITMKLPGYKDVTETFTVTAGETVDVPVQFEAE